MKKAISLILAASLILSTSACNNNSEQTTTKTSTITEIIPETSPETEAVTASETTVTTTVKSEQEPVYVGLRETTVDELRVFRSDLNELGRIIPNVNFSQTFVKFVDGSTIAFSTDDYNSPILCRESSRAIRTDEKEMHEKVCDIPYYNSIETSYEIQWNNPHLSFYESNRDGLKILNFRLQYKLNSSLKINGFLRKVNDDTVEFIIDPAYTYGIPMLTSLTENMKFNINGKTIYADTLSLVDDSAADILENLPLTSDYVYARIEAYGARISYTASDNDTARGYNNEIYIRSAEVLSEDTDLVIEKGYLESDAKKDPQMEMVYRTLLDNKNVYYKDSTNGLLLLDLDFDEKPELLVSDYTDYEYTLRDNENMSTHTQAASDISVYRIEDGKLKFIDKLYNANYFLESTMNSIGLMELEDGRRGWFIPSYKNLSTGENLESYSCFDYLYRLEGDNLLYDELYSRTENEDGSIDYYIDGELVEYTVKKEMMTVYDEPGLEEVTYWNDRDSIFGIYILLSFFREERCETMEKQYNLWSDWLSDGYMKPVKADERDFLFNIAYMVDCFYLGSYNSFLHNNHYGFVGAFAKPVIYLYPEEKTDVSVDVDFINGGKVTVSYPEYNNGWNVTALPDGTVYDKNGNEYYCLYWEGEGSAELDMDKGFCVEGEKTAEFLREKLLYIGLTEREANEFIIYWLPILCKNEYNIISLHTEQYKSAVPLRVSPEPDSEIRVFMTFRASDSFVEIQPQSLPSYERNGFTLVEWGGGEAVLR